jgi:hypothetical protein
MSEILRAKTSGKSIKVGSEICRLTLAGGEECDRVKEHGCGEVPIRHKSN